MNEKLGFRVVKTGKDPEARSLEVIDENVQHLFLDRLSAFYGIYTYDRGSLQTKSETDFKNDLVVQPARRRANAG
jgi:hypothetical protein